MNKHINIYCILYIFMHRMQHVIMTSTNILLENISFCYLIYHPVTVLQCKWSPCLTNITSCAKKYLSLYFSRFSGWTWKTEPALIPVDVWESRSLLGWRMWAATNWAHFYWHGLTLIPAWISNYIHNNVWDKNYLSIPKLQRCNRWSLGMDK